MKTQAESSGREYSEPIVFEGNAAADLADNAVLQRALTSNKRHALGAWLGAAVAIKDPTSVSFRRQSGSHLLVVGQNEELADGVLTAALVGLAATGRSARDAAQPGTNRSAGAKSSERFLCRPLR